MQPNRGCRRGCRCRLGAVTSRPAWVEGGDYIEACCRLFPGLQTALATNGAAWQARSTAGVRRGPPIPGPPNRIVKTLKGQCAITGGTAAPEAFSGTSSHAWVKLQALYELRSAARNTGNAIKKLPMLAVHGRKLYDMQP